MNKIIIALVSLALMASPALAWHVNINAGVSDATALIGASGGSSPLAEGFTYAVSASGGISGSGNIDLHGGGSDDKGGMGLEIGGSGANGNIIATHDLIVSGCCAGQCPCPTGYLYTGSSDVFITGGEGVEVELGGGAKESGAGQELEVSGVRGPKIYADSVQVEMSSSATVNEETTTHVMGAYGENVWFKAFGKQKLDAVDCAVNGFFISVMGYSEPLCEGPDCT